MIDERKRRLRKPKKRYKRITYSFILQNVNALIVKTKIFN